MDALMFSDYVNAIRAIVSLPPSAYLPLAMFSLVFLFLGKLFLGFVRRAHWAILGCIALALFGIVGQFIQEGQHVLALVCMVPGATIGAETYNRLVQSQ
jgi:hypothetical protein